MGEVTSRARHLIAVDGGNSKTDILLLGPDGTVAGHRRQGGFSPVGQTANAELDQLVNGIRELTAQCGNPPIALVAAYLANADFPEQEAEYAAYLRAAGLAERVVVGNDMVALLRSGASGPTGVAVVCGAGINCIGLGTGGRQVRFPALGELTGDWGGGRALAAEAMFLACRGEDGRGPQTLLSAVIADHFNTKTAVDVGIAFSRDRIPSDRLHEVVPLIFRAAARGDEGAVELVRRQAAEVIAMAKVAIVALDLADQDCEVILGGGVLVARDPLLIADITAGLVRMCPAVRIVVLDQPPIVGAALLGIAALADAPDWQLPLDEAVVRRAAAAAVAAHGRAGRA
ncbi:N-acetylglucosamine kinase [Mycolicibacterium sp. CH28]|uniref:N-acetylglucosamine kinase n=1 Tax=Mycolicibacterium sp. CH28 TaxID=2512237 RepID=UPI0013875BA8|nr:BadF/BadG/BcrA/BcrD ATPase family protein [Mycolicibacterium sp. CH28]